MRAPSGASRWIAARKARMTDASAGVGDVERYEQLRSRALGGEPSGFGLGLALLERRGVVAWARAWQTTARPRGPQGAAGAVLELPAVSSELVGALASMALARVAVECPRGRGHLIAWVCPTRLEGCGVHAKDASAVSRGVPS